MNKTKEAIAMIDEFKKEYPHVHLGKLCKVCGYTPYYLTNAKCSCGHYAFENVKAIIEWGKEHSDDKRIRSMKKGKIYSLYYGDRMVKIGTMKELAKFHGCKVETMQYYHSGSWERKRKNSDKCIRVVDADE